MRWEMIVHNGRGQVAFIPWPGFSSLDVPNNSVLRFPLCMLWEWFLRQASGSSEQPHSLQLQNVALHLRSCQLPPDNI